MTSMTSKTIISGAILIGLSNLLSRILGVVRDHLITVNFGTQGIGIHDVGVYYTAFRIPDLLYTLIIYGAISSAFIPIFTEHIVCENKKSAWDFCRNVLNIMMLFLLVVCVFIFVFAPFILKYFALGFDEQRLQLLIDLTRIMLLSPIFFGISSIFQAIQNTFKTFFFYSIAPIVYNLSLICGVLFFSNTYGVYGLSYAVVVGAFLHMAVQFPKIRSLGFRYNFYINLKADDIKKFFYLIVPRIIGLSVDQLSIMINSSIATTLSYSAVVILPLAINIDSLPLGLFGIAFAVASFSIFAEKVAKNEHTEVSKILKNSISNILFLVIPASFGLFFLRFEIINLIFGGGAFTQNDVILTGNTLGFLLVALCLESLVPLFARVFYSYNDTKTPFFIGLFALVLSVSTSLFCTKILNMDVYGIAIGIAVSIICNGVLLAVFLNKKLKLKDFLPLKNVLFSFCSALIMYLSLLGIAPFIKNYFQTFGGKLNDIVFLSISIIFGVSIYILFASIFKIPEIVYLREKLRNFKF